MHVRGTVEGPCVCEVPAHMNQPEPELCSYCLVRPSVAVTPDLDNICDECGDGPLCDTPFPDDPSAGGCWLLRGHEGDHDIYGGTYLWPQTLGGRQGAPDTEIASPAGSV